MNPIHDRLLEKASNEAIYNTYLYLSGITTPAAGDSLQSIVSGLEAALKSRKSGVRSAGEMNKLSILKNAASRNETLAGSRIGNLTRLGGGMTACTFTKPDGTISVVFRGTGSGEWIDNGEGLSGIPEENTYITYAPGGMEAYRTIIEKDYATDQQVEALNWFNKIAYENNWNESHKISVSGHSKGGNKAQFITIHSDLVDSCYSFDGQGFSPEAISAFKKQYPHQYEARRQNIMSFSTENDYVNVLGSRLAPENHIYFFKSRGGIHHIEAMLARDGSLNPKCEQGKFSEYVEAVSERLMNMKPAVRQYATLGVMNIFQKYLGEGAPVNGDAVSLEKTIAGMAVAISQLLRIPE